MRVFVPCILGRQSPHAIGKSLTHQSGSNRKKPTTGVLEFLCFYYRPPLRCLPFNMIDEKGAIVPSLAVHTINVIAELPTCSKLFSSSSSSPSLRLSYFHQNAFPKTLARGKGRDVLIDTS